ncbi:hypothetical protein TRFO_28856 [Tritrichomonas foetus]|uniref:RRM domain-containing protein n=1 Tax=Tritrichomonas foetus TaxID=1144522 RepID=A0A1J4K1Q0_9EUKA|nr:hypothetical protein TRFO_28856 [Tritrichomonas foetus]|eukprot:OHT03668.1 hypothetical protein TRFO_28856 [Tritrichomonas foetus]
MNPDDEIERQMQILLNTVEEIENQEEKNFIDKSTAKEVVKVKENDTFTKNFQAKMEKKKRVLRGDQKISKEILRSDAQGVWCDPSLAEWPENDYRILVRGIALASTDQDLIDTFSKFKSLAKVKIVRDSSGRNKRFGFVSFLDVNDYIEAMKMGRPFVGKRRCTLEPSKWKDRNFANAKM